MKLAKIRLDDRVVGLGLAESKAKAQALILAGHIEVLIHGQWQRQFKAGHPIALDASVRCLEQDLDVGRGAKKLRGAMKEFGLDLKGLNLGLDVGSSTGGFTQVLLEAGVGKVVALDVGTHQLHERLRRDPRVIVMEQTHVLQIGAEFWAQSGVGIPFDVAVMDVSFIGVKKILDHVHPWLKTGAHFVVLVKPQFELGPEWVVGGIVRDEGLQRRAVDEVREHIESRALYRVDAEVPSSIKGQEGNQEYFLLLTALEAVLEQ